MNSKGRMRRAGFTLIEVLLVVAIIGMLAAVATMGVSRHSGTAKKRTTKMTCENVKGAISTYELEYGKYPDNLGQLVEDKGDGPVLDMDEEPTDAWGNLLKFEIRGGRIRVISPGPDGRFGGGDDITSR